MKFECCKKFPKGARVEAIEEIFLASHFVKKGTLKIFIKVGSKGTVVDNDIGRDTCTGLIGVKWDKRNREMHDCWGLGGCKKGHGWYVKPEQIRIIKI